METEKNGTEQVAFEAGFKARIMGIDGTWWRNCSIDVISQTGAKLSIEGSVDGLKLNEFFLMLSSVGNAHRRCELVWVNGDEIGVHFLHKNEKRRAQQRKSMFNEQGDFVP